MSGEIVTINSRKFDGSIGKSWTCELIEQAGNQLIFVGEFDREISHEHLGVVKRGTISYEYYWLDRWYNIFKFHEPDGSFRDYYCNINMPPTFENGVLDYVDLDIDILVAQNGTYSILDSDEFEENAVKHEYSDDLRADVFRAVDELTAMIESREFPFNR
jgi:protein associated with RNAse G/E